MDSFTAAAIILDTSGTFTINKVEVYRKGKPTGHYKFQEIVSINSADAQVLQNVTNCFPKKIYKTKTNYKLTYVGSAAVSVINRVSPLLKNENKLKAANILLKLHAHKQASRSHAPQERYAFRNALREEITGLS